MRPPARITFIPLLALIYVSVCGGAYGMEDMVSSAGPGGTIFLLLTAAVLWGLPMALAMAELGAGWPVLGGYYRWTRTAFGDFWGFQQGWWQMLSSWFDNALYPVIVSDYLATLVPALGGGWKIVVRLSIIILFSITNVLGVGVVGRLTVLFDILMVLPFVPFVILGLAQWTHNPLVPFTPPGDSAFSALGVGMLIVMWGYSGYETMSTAITEVDNPQRNFPRALLWSIPVTVASYAVPLVVGVAAHGQWQTWTDGTLGDAAATIGGPWLHTSMLLGAVVSSMGLFNGLFLSYSRLPVAMAQDGFLMKWLAGVSPRWGTPVRSIAANACVYAALAFFDFRDLVVIDTILFSAGYILIYFTLVRFRARFPDVARPFRIPGGPVVLWIVVLVPTAVAAAACVMADFEEIRWGLAAAATGPLAYLLIRLSRRLAPERKQ